MPEAIYVLDMSFVFAGHPPRDFNKAAPEVEPTHHLAVETVLDILRHSGYTPIRTGHGSRRLTCEGD